MQSGAGVTPEFEQYQGSEPLQYVISLNLHRRHLNESQRAVIAERLANMPVGRNWESNSANWPDNISQAEVAERLNVSERTIRRIKAVKEAQPELIEQITRGKMTAGKAYQEIKKQEKLATIQEIAEQKKTHPPDTSERRFNYGINL